MSAHKPEETSHVAQDDFRSFDRGRAERGDLGPDLRIRGRRRWRRVARWWLARRRLRSSVPRSASEFSPARPTTAPAWRNGCSTHRTGRWCAGSTSATEPLFFARSKRQPRPRQRPGCFRLNHSAAIRRGRSDRDSSPCPTPPRSLSQTSPSSPRMHRLPQALAAGSANRRSGRHGCRST